MSLTVAYALTSTARDVYADMTLISLWSVQRYAPRCRIVVILDSLSAQHLRERLHPILSSGAEIKELRCEEAPSGWRNRFIKTQLRKYVSGPLLYLDGDTLVRGDLARVFEASTLVAAVPNHNGRGTATEIPIGEREILARIGWSTELPAYANGGVLFMADQPEVHEFCECWHERWSESFSMTGKHFDQPALNHALHETGVSFSWLDHRYNAQVHARPSTACDAIVWHIYRSEHHPNPPNVLDQLVSLQMSGSVDVKSAVTEACLQPHPWIAANALDRLAIRSMTSNSRILDGDRWERLWLTRNFGRLLTSPARTMRKRIAAGFESA